MKMMSSTAARAWLAAAAVVCSMALTGCASSVSARVTSFQQWPADAAGQTYQFASSDAQARSLEYQAYQDVVRANIGATGLMEAPRGSAARFDVKFDYGVSQVQVMTRQPYDPFFYGGGGFYGPYGRFWGPGYGFGGFWGPQWVDVPVTAYRNSVNLRITDKMRGGAEVYQSTASTLSNQPDLIRVMPYLVQSIFDNFPGNNGSEREIEYKTR